VWISVIGCGQRVVVRKAVVPRLGRCSYRALVRTALSREALQAVAALEAFRSVGADALYG
jgi:hypothetical protein